MRGKMTIMTRLLVTIVASVVISSSVLAYLVSKRQKEQMLVEVYKQARMAADQLISTRAIIADKQKIINNDATTGHFEFKGVIPAVVGREVAEHFSQTTIFKMKQTSLKYRNPTNKPDTWETRQLERFERFPETKDFSEVTTLDDSTSVFRLMVPLKINEACLKCHGDPATSPTGDGKDIAGRPMENYKLGEVRGGISVIAPMGAINAAIVGNRNFNLMGNGIYVLVISGVVFFITRGVVSFLKRLVDSLKNGADEVTSASSQISSSSQSLAEGASNQAASIEETSASIEQMSSMTSRNADNAKEANQLAIRTKSSAEDGNNVLETLQSSMHELNSGNDKVLTIIKSIDEIAFQTNLLALNAAVEAARAGEHGKGFAVVAAEVRNLAQRCSVASKETADMINSRVTSTRNATKIADELATKLKEIVAEAKKVTDLAGEIAAASTEQAEGISQISKAVTTMDTVTQSNAANAEEMASASEELSAQAENLKAFVYELAKEIGVAEQNAALSDNLQQLGRHETRSRSLSSAGMHHKPRNIVHEKRPGASALPGAKASGIDSKNIDRAHPKAPEDVIPLNNDFDEF